MSELQMGLYCVADLTVTNVDADKTELQMDLVQAEKEADE